jgi:hypothetical protein
MNTPFRGVTKNISHPVKRSLVPESAFQRERPQPGRVLPRRKILGTSVSFEACAIAPVVSFEMGRVIRWCDLREYRA